MDVVVCLMMMFRNNVGVVSGQTIDIMAVAGCVTDIRVVVDYILLITLHWLSSANV